MPDHMMKDKGAMGNMPDRMMQRPMPEQAMMQRPMPDRAMPDRVMMPDQMPNREMMPKDMPDQAKMRLMQPSAEISAVLVSRLTNMTPEELRSLDSAITPEVARVLMKLLPELRELIERVSQQGKERMPEEQMGALAGMR
jgi:hypothetical protein